jgi:hypothetical protein
MVSAIGDGRGPGTVLDEITRAEIRPKVLEAELARLRASPHPDASKPTSENKSIPSRKS